MSDPLISQTIGQYEIISVLGKGGMATVYRARQVNMQRDVAIKIMSADLIEDPEFVARFEREAHVIARLEHPRILPVHDFGLDGDLFYLVMRLVEGESLYYRLRNGPVPLKKVAKYLAQIAEALDYAHSQGVIHRDLKPNNVLIDKWDNLYLMDFGLAKMVAASQSLTQTGMVLGTPTYMAPEQWRGEPVDARTDVYALGVILYEMVLGRTPFESDTPFTLMYKHINDAPPSPCEMMPELPEAVEAVILKALAKNKEDRYQSAGELARAFGAVVRVAGTLANKAHDSHVDDAVAEAPAGDSPGDDGETGADIPAPAEIVPPPAEIVPPPPPIPLPPDAHMAGEPVAPPDSDRQRRRIDRAAASQALRDAVEAVDHSLEAVVEKAAEAVPPLPGSEGGASGDGLPENALAFAAVGRVLAAGEELIGVIDIRGTRQWAMWKRLVIGGLALNIMGGILNAGLLSVLGWLAWAFLFVQVVRTWRGDIGQYYLGITDRRVIVAEHDPDGVLISDEISAAGWDAVERLRLTDRYVLLDMALGDEETLSVAALVVAQGAGGLGDQLQWLPDSPVARWIAARGFEVRNL